MRPQAEIRIGIDLMGSDNPPESYLQAAEELAPELQKNGIALIPIGAPHLASRTRLPFHPAAEVIAMEDSPLIALRRKKDASLSVGMNLLKKGKIDAFVSAGNTGALVASAKMTLSMLPHLLRPALLALMPTKKHPFAILDVGANVQFKPVHLMQFAFIGAAYQRARGIARPAIGLLNIGREALKGTSDLRIAYQELKKISEQPDSFFRFDGNIEGREVFEGNIDVLITDGFTGNVFLKTAEGIASLILDRLNENLSSEALEPMRRELGDLQRHLHYAEYPGALLCGVNGIVIKCHGHSTPQAFASGIREAARLAQEGFLQILQDKLLTYDWKQKI